MRNVTASIRLRSPPAIAFAGFIALAVAMGIGRFAFTPVLPLMQDDFAVSVADGGWLAASNYAGYLLGSVCAGLVGLRPPIAIRGGLIAIGVLTIAMAFANTYHAWFVLRGLAGVASAFVFIAVSAWTLAQLETLQRSRLSTTVYAGVGAGILAAGLVCVAVIDLDLRSTHAWIILGFIALALCAVTWGHFARPLGTEGRVADTTTRRAWNGEQTRLIVAYGFFGFGYIVPATFLPVLAKQLLPDPGLFAWTWPLFGLAAAVSTLALAVVPRSFDMRRAWICAQVVMAAGVALPLAWPATWVVIVAALSVGGTFMIITAAGMREARRVAPQRTAALMAAMTSAFAAGQIAGPIAVSVLAGVPGAFDIPLMMASVLLIAGAWLIVRGRGHPASYSLCRTTEDGI